MKVFLREKTLIESWKFQTSILFMLFTLVALLFENLVRAEEVLSGGSSVEAWKKVESSKDDKNVWEKIKKFKEEKEREKIKEKIKEIMPKIPKKKIPQEKNLFFEI